MKFSGSFNIFAQNIACRYLLELPRRGGSNECQKSMFLSRNKKIDIYPYKPQFTRDICVFSCCRDGTASARQF